MAPEMGRPSTGQRGHEEIRTAMSNPVDNLPISEEVMDVNAPGVGTGPTGPRERISVLISPGAKVGPLTIKDGS
jgi:hypothetical protein